MVLARHLWVVAAAAATLSMNPAVSCAEEAQQAQGAATAAAEISSDAFQSQLTSPEHHFTVVDVRTPEEYAEGHVPGAINIPLDQLDSRAAELQSDGEIVVYCLSGARSAQAIEILRHRDFKRVLHLSGDFTAWHESGRPQQKSAR